MPTLKAAAALVVSSVVMVATFELIRRLTPRIEESVNSAGIELERVAAVLAANLRFEHEVRRAIPGTLWEAWIACHDAALELEENR